MIRRVLAAILVIWALGFLVFASTLPRPAGNERTDAVIVPTGAAGRIDHGVAVVRSDRARLLLVTGVDPNVKPREFAAQFGVPMNVMECCVTLGFDAVDTRSNAAETLRWVKDNDIRSLRLVTSDWHMRRAAGELRARLPTNIAIVEDAVSTEPSFAILLIEYNKWLASMASHLVPGL